MSPEARERSFDELAKGLASGEVSRRRAIRLMGAALLGGTLASLGFGGVAAAAPPGCTHNGKPCKRDKQCCSGNCSSHGTCVGGAPGGPLDCLPPCSPCTSSIQCCAGSCRSGNGGLLCRTRLPC